MACPVCGHEWQEENHYNAREQAASNAIEVLVLGAMWLAAIALVCAAVGLLLYVLWTASGGSLGAAIGVALLFAILGVSLLITFAGYRRYRSPGPRLPIVSFWYRGWLGQNRYR
jgi:hypothetical protein